MIAASAMHSGDRLAAIIYLCVLPTVSWVALHWSYKHTRKGRHGR